MQRRGFIGSFVATLFSLPTIVKQATAENPVNANPAPVPGPTAWTANATNTTAYRVPWDASGNGIVATGPWNTTATARYL